MEPAEPALSLLYRRSTAPGPRIRVGVLLDSPILIACFARVLDDIVASNFAELSFLVYNAPARHRAARSVPRRSPLERLRRFVLTPAVRHGLVYQRYLSWDAARNNRMANPLGLCDCSAILDKVPSIEVVPISSKATHFFPAETVATLREQDLDVILRFGFNIIRGDILQAARHGIWSFHHGDNEFYRGGPALFWELAEGRPRSGALLQVLTEELDAGLVLAKGQFATQQGLSLARNRYAPYWGTTHFVIQKLYELHQHGWEFVRSRALPPTPYRGRRRIYRAPGNWDVVRWIGPQLVAKATKRVFRRPFKPAPRLHWRIAIRRSVASLLEQGPSALPSFRWIDAPRGHFYADPMLLVRDGRTWLFVEDYSYAERRGCVVVAEVAASGKIGPFTRCLVRPYHLSYPCVFEQGGEVFMLPETKESGSVELFRATSFPLEWTLEKVLLPMPAVDTTPLHRDGRWWFFTTIQEPAEYSSFGQLFSAPALTDPWTLHPSSAISSTVESARSAGRIIEIGGRLVRPTQSGCPNYGYSFSLNEITRLDGEGFAERPLAAFEPAWHPDLRGMHTYARAGEIELIDGRWAVDPRSVLG